MTPEEQAVLSSWTSFREPFNASGEMFCGLSKNSRICHSAEALLALSSCQKCSAARVQASRYGGLELTRQVCRLNNFTQRSLFTTLTYSVRTNCRFLSQG